MLHQSAKWISNLRRKLMDDIVFLEGGLGSQLTGFMLYCIRKESNPATRCDITYFLNRNKTFGGKGAPAQREWELDRYGIPLDHQDFVSVDRSRYRASYEDQAQSDEVASSRLNEHDWNQMFPVVPEAVEVARRLGLLDGQGYAAIHVRRGDYLDVSSRVVELEESIRMVSRFSAMFPPRVILLCDEDFSEEDRQKVALALPNQTHLFVDEPDPHIAHGLLRMAKVLVASNSTFSWTAAMLAVSQDSLAFAPQHFFNPPMIAVNRLFRGPASWMLISKSL